MSPTRLALLAVLGCAPGLRAADAEFFEKRVRPVLVEHCYKCHADGKADPKGGLRVDGRAALLKGGDSGPAVIPGDAGKSKLVEAVRYANPDMLMPPKGRLPAAAVADLEAWVAAGAVWPDGPTAAATAPAGPVKGFDLAARKAGHWAWRSVQPQTPPAVRDTHWPADPVDHFVLAKLESAGLRPAPPADPAGWLRRVTFALSGLPPTPAEVLAFLADPSPAARAAVVDRLLASATFGERWGRHWLDLVRYAETRGHEFDPDIPNAHEYRDYVVRAINRDVPYSQFVREHVAGDVLTEPRLDPTTGAEESVLGTAFWHLGEEVHSPVDVRQDQADRLDNRIDVFTKTFLGLTVACARCHDHKFDAIAAKDYYALFGLLEGSAYRQSRPDGRRENRAVAAELAKLRADTSTRIAAGTRGASDPPDRTPDAAYRSWLGRAKVVVDYANPRPGEWLPDDVSFGPGPRPAGTWVAGRPGETPAARCEPRTAAAFDRFWAGLRLTPGAAPDFGALGGRPRAGFTIRTPEAVLERKRLFSLVRGGGLLYAAVDGHTVIAGPLHGALVQTLPPAADYRWVGQDVSGYVGQRFHVEMTADPKTDFAVALVVQADDPPPGVPPPQVVPPPAPAGAADVARDVAAAEATLAGRVRWDSRLVPALWDGPGVDEAVFVRGNPRTPGEVVPGRLLEALAGPGRIPHTGGSGRLELAAQLTDPAVNPFVGRVMVNRVWHHLFGRGIVPTVDNFGALGEAPSHPELLDYLATEFVRDGWSLKRLVRRLALSSAYAMSSAGDPAADAADPGNALLHHFRLRRLDGEAIRDSLLSVSGRLDPLVGGPSVPIALTPFLDGRGRPGSGPADGAGRRSLYLAVRRNFLSPLLLAFDTPIPFSTVGRRQVSNVPAQALIMLNDPFVRDMAGRWGQRVAAASGSVEDKVRAMVLAGFGRPAADGEVRACAGFVAGREADPAAWADLAHALVNAKEFVFVR